MHGFLEKRQAEGIQHENEIWFEYQKYYGY
jgi:hypothetical protein